MPTYNIALVKFSPKGRAYPINSGITAEPGRRVVVRMVGQARSLQTAEVVKHADAPRLCRNSIVCREEDADAYGEGPPGVQTAIDLERFLKSDASLNIEPRLIRAASLRRHPKSGLSPTSGVQFLANMVQRHEINSAGQASLSCWASQALLGAKCANARAFGLKPEICSWTLRLSDLDRTAGIR
ncbi:hypothetical protein EV132_1652 [Rhizobium sullae]|uniref:Uncharacterized protein n=1 Tax=Rhizobium sullae TaxID=50338 RepID=A0A4R3PRT6_RHISU|nr:hypothetical protein EV132_1652 [Rhizobium sullae]